MASIHFQQCLFLLLFFVSFRTANAQPPQAGSLSLPPIAFERLGVEHGLPNEYVNCIAQDRFGFMWFGTKNGLCRYDGRTFKTYKSISGDSSSLMGNEVLALFSDASGVLWVGANGLHRFNADHDNFTRIVPPRYPALSNNLKYVAKICEDHSGNLWFGTFGRGLYKLNPASGQLLRVKLGDEQAKPSSWEVILSLFSSGLDSVWVTDGTYGLTILNARTGRKDYYSLANKGQLQKTFLDRAGRLWLGAMHEPFMQIQLQAHRVIASRRVEEIKLANFFTCMEEDHYGNLWIGNAGGPLHFQPEP
jgi:ligand-binding sensor domain-containing protein